MPSPFKHIDNLISKAGDIAETKVEVWKLQAAGKIATTVSSLISVMTIAIITVAAITIISMGAAFWIGSSLGKTSYGFFIVGGFYAFFGILVYLFRNSWIKKPLDNLIIDKIVK